MNILFESENLWASGMFQAGWAATGTWVMRISNPQVHWLFYLELKNLEIGRSYNVRGRGRRLCWILCLFRSLLCCRFTSLEDYGNMSLKIQEKDTIQAYICKQDLKDGLLSTVFSLWSLCAFVITIFNSLQVKKKMHNQFRSKIVKKDDKVTHLHDLWIVPWAFVRAHTSPTVSTSTSTSKKLREFTDTNLRWDSQVFSSID